MMALQALRTIEVHRANVEDLAEKGGNLALLVRGKTRDRIVYLRPDTAVTDQAVRGAARRSRTRDAAGTPLFTRRGPSLPRIRLSRRIHSPRRRTSICVWPA